MKSIAQHKIHYILRIASAMCFIGHGAFGLITKPIWCNYFAVFGISPALSYQLMPVIGTIDIAFGLIILFYPVRAIPAWLVIWGLFTALLRPLSGEPFAEFIERAGNYGAPLGLLILAGLPKNLKSSFKPMAETEQPAGKTYAQLAIFLRVVVFLLLLGHGWLNLIEKKGILAQYALLGFSNPVNVAQLVGISEILSAFIILIRPIRQFLFVILIWKMASELFYPHYELFEWIERGGSYGAIMALWLLTRKNANVNSIHWKIFSSEEKEFSRS